MTPRLWRRPVTTILVAIVVPLTTTTTAAAFTTTTTLRSCPSLLTTHLPKSVCTPPLFLSSNSNDAASNFGTDELAKLRAKREEIMAKKRAQESERTKPQSIPDIPPDVAAADDGSSTATTDDSAVTEDIVAGVKLPPRPSVMGRAKRREEARARDGGDGKKVKKKDDKPKAVDYLANYDDENELHIPNRIGFGTMSWGDAGRGFVSDGRLSKKQIESQGKFLPGDLQVAYNTLLNNGIRFIDTSESYGISSRPTSLSAEHMLGRFSEENLDNSPLVATKFANPYSQFLSSPQIRVGSGAVLKAIKGSCARMETSCVELYQIQSTFLYAGGTRALADGLAMALDRGYCNHVGGCHLSPRQMKSLQRKMDQRGFSLSSNQFSFSLTNRRALKDGTLKACKDLGIIPIAHTPFDNGLATGKYTANDPSGGSLSSAIKYDFKKVLEPLIPLHDAQVRVAGKVKARLKTEFQNDKDRMLGGLRYGPGAGFNQEVTTAQVAINYVVAKGAVPIPGINNLKEAEELLGCLGWGLNEEEVAILDQAAELAKR